MFFLDFLVALVIALVLSLILTGIFGWRRRENDAFAGSLLFVFFMFFLFAWAGGVWLTPFGPAMWGGHWAAFLLVPLFIALLLGALIPPTKPRSRREAAVQAEETAAADTALGAFFWILIIGLAISILVHYV